MKRQRSSIQVRYCIRIRRVLPRDRCGLFSLCGASAKAMSPRCEAQQLAGDAQNAPTQVKGYAHDFVYALWQTNRVRSRNCGDLSGIANGGCEVDHCAKAMIGFVGAHGDAFELLGLAQDGLDQVPPLVEFAIER